MVDIHSRFSEKHATAFALNLMKLQEVTKTFVPHFRATIHFELNNKGLNIYTFGCKSPHRTVLWHLRSDIVLAKYVEKIKYPKIQITIKIKIHFWFCRALAIFYSSLSKQQVLQSRSKNHSVLLVIRYERTT